LTDTAIDRLKYRDDSSTPTVVESLGIGYQQLIRVFNAWVKTRIDEEFECFSVSTVNSTGYGTITT
jgi:hypothetical protein